MIFVQHSRAKVDRKIRYGMLENAGGPRQKSRINSEDALGTPIRRASHLGVRRSRASVLNNFGKNVFSKIKITYILNDNESGYMNSKNIK